MGFEGVVYAWFVKIWKIFCSKVCFEISVGSGSKQHPNLQHLWTGSELFVMQKKNKGH